MVRPYFDSGSVETALSGARQAQTHSILAEVEEEKEFERLIMRMRGCMAIKDRVHMRIPFFKVRVVA